MILKELPMSAQAGTPTEGLTKQGGELVSFYSDVLKSCQSAPVMV